MDTLNRIILYGGIIGITAVCSWWVFSRLADWIAWGFLTTP